MLTGKVVGSLVSTVKNENVKDLKLMAVQLIENGKPDRIIIAVDIVRISGIGDYVYLTSGKEAALGIGKGLIPVDAGIVGIIDDYNLKD